MEGVLKIKLIKDWYKDLEKYELENLFNGNLQLKKVNKFSAIIKLKTN